MPRGTDVARATTATSIAVSLPDDIRADLLRSQAGAIETPQKLPIVRVMPAGAGLYEFGDTGETADSFMGVVLGSHGKNTLWDRKYGSDLPTGMDEDEAKRPACSSGDGKYGIPRAGFRHLALSGAEATGDERILCSSCPYNKFGTGNLLVTDRNRKGKAVSNYRSLYVLVADRETPVELVIPATSIAAFDEYSSGLMNQRLPIQAVVTEFRQERLQRGTVRYAVATFRAVEGLDATGLSKALAVREAFRSTIQPEPDITLQPQQGSAQVAQMVNEAEGGVPNDEDDDLPF